LSIEASVAFLLCLSRSCRLRGKPGTAVNHLKVATDILHALTGAAHHDLSLDLRRERSAVRLLLGESHNLVGELEAVFYQHQVDGEKYRAALCGLLLARASPAEWRGWLQQVEELGVSLASPAMRTGSLLIRAQALHRGATPDKPDWHEAFQCADRAYELSVDPLTKLEASLVLGGLQLRAFDLEQAEHYLALAKTHVLATGNLIGHAGVHKLEARVLGARATRSGGPQRVQLAARSIILFGRSSRLFSAIGMTQTASLSRLEQQVMTSLAQGSSIDVEVLRSLVQSAGTDKIDQIRRTLALSRRLIEMQNFEEASQLLEEVELEANRSANQEIQIATLLLRASVEVHRDEGKSRKLINDLTGALSRVDWSVSQIPARALLHDSSNELTAAALDLAVQVADGKAALTLSELRRTGRLGGLLRTNFRPLENRTDNHQDANVILPEQRVVLTKDESESNSDLLVDIYDPTPFDLQNNLDTLTDCQLIVSYLDHGDRIVVIWHQPTTGEFGVTKVEVNPAMAHLLELLGTSDRARDVMRLNLRATDLELFNQLLPENVRRILISADPTTSRTLLIPDGRLWAVPWNGLSVPGFGDGHTDCLLIELTTVHVFPSLRMHGHASARLRRPRTGRLLAWKAPTINSTDEFALLAAGNIETSQTAVEFRNQCLASHEFDIVVIASHGSAKSGFGRSLFLDDVHTIEAHEFIGASVADTLLLGACHSAFCAGSTAGEPLGLATLALVAGARQLLGATASLPVESEKPTLLADVHRLIANDIDVPSSIRAACQNRGGAALRSKPLLWWASLIGITHIERPGSAAD
jgi:CHAT domain